MALSTYVQAIVCAWISMWINSTSTVHQHANTSSPPCSTDALDALGGVEDLTMGMNPFPSSNDLIDLPGGQMDFLDPTLWGLWIAKETESLIPRNWDLCDTALMSFYLAFATLMQLCGAIFSCSILGMYSKRAVLLLSSCLCFSCYHIYLTSFLSFLWLLVRVANMVKCNHLSSLCSDGQNACAAIFFSLPDYLE